MRSLLFLCLVAGTLSAAEPIPKSDGPPKAVASVKSSNFSPPDNLESKGGFAIYLPPSDVVAVEYVALDGEEPFPASLIGGSPTAFVFFTRGLPEKSYRFVGVASDSGGKLTRKQFSVTVGEPKKDPPTTEPPKQPSLTYYFLVVRADGPATTQFTKIMQSPSWEKLKKDGHLVSDMPVSDVAKLGITQPDVLPCVITLQESNMKSKILRPAIALPTTDQAILDLPKGVSK